MHPLRENYYLVGQEKGRIDIIDIKTGEKNDPTFILETHHEFKEKTHVHSFKRTGDRDIFAVATYKGLFVLRINSQTFEIQKLHSYRNELAVFNELHAVCYLHGTLLLA